jgi:hypothetical protein
MDLGVEKTLLEDRLVLDVTAFKNNTRNEITTVTSGGVTKFTNLTSTRCSASRLRPRRPCRRNST